MNKLLNLAFSYLKNKISFSHSAELQKNFPREVSKNSNIQKMLYSLLFKYNASRAYIFIYHNGGKSINGLDFYKASNTFEVGATGVKPQMLQLQNLPISLFAFWNMQIVEKNDIVHKNIECIRKNDVGVYEVLKNQEIKGICVTGLYDLNGCPIGFVGLDFPCVDNLAEKAIFELKQKAVKIGVMLS